METIVIMGSISLAICIAGVLFFLVIGSDVPQYIKILTGISVVPLIICFAILSAEAEQSDECKVKYEKVNVELYKKVG
jgi:uncharacterized membrane protein